VTAVSVNDSGTLTATTGSNGYAVLTITACQQNPGDPLDPYVVDVTFTAVGYTPPERVNGSPATYVNWYVTSLTPTVTPTPTRTRTVSPTPTETPRPCRPVTMNIGPIGAPQGTQVTAVSVNDSGTLTDTIGSNGYAVFTITACQRNPGDPLDPYVIDVTFTAVGYTPTRRVNGSPPPSMHWRVASLTPTVTPTPTRTRTATPTPTETPRPCRPVTMNIGPIGVPQGTKVTAASVNDSKMLTARTGPSGYAVFTITACQQNPGIPLDPYVVDVTFTAVGYTPSYRVNGLPSVSVQWYVRR
jgi:hypothetical protein